MIALAERWSREGPNGNAIRRTRPCSAALRQAHSGDRLLSRARERVWTDIKPARHRSQGGHELRRRFQQVRWALTAITATDFRARAGFSAISHVRFGKFHNPLF